MTATFRPSSHRNTSHAIMTTEKKKERKKEKSDNATHAGSVRLKIFFHSILRKLKIKKFCIQHPNKINLHTEKKQAGILDCRI